MRTKIIIGNWKMNKTGDETKKFFEELNGIHFEPRENSIYGIAVPFPNLALAAVLKKGNLVLSSQDVSKFDKGAHTGEVSCAMLKSYDVSYAIIGHSERRQFNHESNELINEKAKQALANNITPIICVGETLEQYEQGKSKEIVKEQVLKCIQGLDPSKIVIAYEPIWAIGTGKTATIEYAEEMCAFIRGLSSQETLIQYGGSVTPATIKDLLNQPNVDGALVGGASLEPKSFVELISK